MSQLAGTAIGALLCLTTAIGCVACEHVVKNYSFRFLLLLKLAELLLISIAILFLPSSRSFSAEVGDLIGSGKLAGWSAVYVAAGLTIPLWYILTREYGVLVSSTFEFKYIIVLTLIYLVVGEDKVTAKMRALYLLSYHGNAIDLCRFSDDQTIKHRLTLLLNHLKWLGFVSMSSDAVSGSFGLQRLHSDSGFVQITACGRTAVNAWIATEHKPDEPDNHNKLSSWSFLLQHEEVDNG